MTSYNREKFPGRDKYWWQVKEKAKQAKASRLDVAQLIKHYFGLSRLLTNGDKSGWKPTRVTLQYLFWKRTNWEGYRLFAEHRKAVEWLEKTVSKSSITFRWTTYPQLWEPWSKTPTLKPHVERLKARYEAGL